MEKASIEKEEVEQHKEGALCRESEEEEVFQPWFTLHKIRLQIV